MLRRLYTWVIHWADTPFGTIALFLMAFAESSFFPIPPDVLLIALAIGAPARAFRFAAICTVGSVLGGVCGYAIGKLFFTAIGQPILALYGYTEQFAMVQAMFIRYGAWFVGVAGFTPIPYKVFTIAAGAFGMNLGTFIVVSALSRGARFFLVAALIHKFGAPIRIFIEKYFNLLTIAFIILLIFSFVAVKYLF